MFQPNNAICGESGGGGNRTRARFQSDGWRSSNRGFDSSPTIWVASVEEVDDGPRTIPRGMDLWSGHLGLQRKSLRRSALHQGSFRSARPKGEQPARIGRCVRPATTVRSSGGEGRSDCDNRKRAQASKQVDRRDQSLARDRCERPDTRASQRGRTLEEQTSRDERPSRRSPFAKTRLLPSIPADQATHLEVAIVVE